MRVAWARTLSFDYFGTGNYVLQPVMGAVCNVFAF